MKILLCLYPVSQALRPHDDSSELSSHAPPSSSHHAVFLPAAAARHQLPVTACFALVADPVTVTPVHNHGYIHREMALPKGTISLVCRTRRVADLEATQGRRTPFFLIVASAIVSLTHVSL
jgi:hypothetical protein